METKNAKQFDLKKINKIFIWIAFGCVFIFTLALSMCNLQFSKNEALRNNAMKWIGISFAIAAVVLAITWVSVYFGLKKKHESQNTKDIKKIIKEKKKDDSK